MLLSLSSILTAFGIGVALLLFAVAFVAVFVFPTAILISGLLHLRPRQKSKERPALRIEHG